MGQRKHTLSRSILIFNQRSSPFTRRSKRSRSNDRLRERSRSREDSYRRHRRRYKIIHKKILPRVSQERPSPKPQLWITTHSFFAQSFSIPKKINWPLSNVNFVSSDPALKSSIPHHFSEASPIFPPNISPNPIPSQSTSQPTWFIKLFINIWFNLISDMNYRPTTEL